MYALLTLKVGTVDPPPRVVIKINGVTLEPARIMSDQGFATYIFTNDLELPPPEEQPTGEQAKP